MTIDEGDRQDGEERGMEEFKSPLVSRGRSMDPKEADQQKLGFLFWAVKEKEMNDNGCHSMSLPGLLGGRREVGWEPRRKVLEGSFTHACMH